MIYWFPYFMGSAHKLSPRPSALGRSPRSEAYLLAAPAWSSPVSSSEQASSRPTCISETSTHVERKQRTDKKVKTDALSIEMVKSASQLFVLISSSRYSNRFTDMMLHLMTLVLVLHPIIQTYDIYYILRLTPSARRKICSPPPTMHLWSSTWRSLSRVVELRDVSLDWNDSIFKFWGATNTGRIKDEEQKLKSILN